MNISSLTSSHLQQLLDLTRRREAIVADLEKLDQRISSLYGNGSSSTLPETTVRRRGRPPGRKSAVKAVKPVKTRKRTPRGTMKQQVLAILKAAGDEGMAVGDVAEKIGAKKAAVNVWFYTTGKKVEGLKKIAPGHFALTS